MKTASCTLFVAAAFALAAAGEAAAPIWKPFASAASIIPAQAPINFYSQHIHQIAVRADQPGTVNWTIRCQGHTAVKAGQILLLPDVANAQLCVVGQTEFVSSADGAGQAKVELLKSP